MILNWPNHNSWVESKVLEELKIADFAFKTICQIIAN